MFAALHQRIALPALLVLASGVGCAHHRACSDGCGVPMGYEAGLHHGCQDCDSELPRARHPFDHLRTAFHGGCGEVYWGEWPDYSMTCDDCNRASGAARRGAFWQNLWGVRHDQIHESHMTVGEVGCDTCGDAATHFEGEVIFDGPADAESIETPTPATEEPSVPRSLPGPENDAQPSLETPPATSPTPGQTSSGSASRSIVRPSRTSPARR